MRRKALKYIHPLAIETLVKVIKVGETQLKRLRADCARDKAGDLDLELAQDVLCGMRDGKFAGPLATPKTGESEWLFALIAGEKMDWIVGQLQHDEWDMLHGAFMVDYCAW